MSYKTLSEFEASFQPVPLCLVCAHRSDDRELILKRCLHRLSGGTHLQYRYFDKANWRVALLSEISALNLLAGRSVIVIRELEYTSKELTEYMKAPRQDLHLLVGSKVMREVKGALSLDLSHEKPWERAKRIATTLDAKIIHAGKRISPELLSQLIDRFGGDWVALENEIEKIFTFSGDRAEISANDIAQVSQPGQKEDLWRLAERIIWRAGTCYVPDLEAAEILTLIAALRFHLQLGRRLINLSSDPLPPDIKPYQVEKYRENACDKGIFWFESGLCRLIETEKVCKSSSIDTNLALLHFVTCLRNALSDRALDNSRGYIIVKK